MPLIEKVLAARQEMKLVADKTVRTNKYSFKYATLGQVLEVVVPTLAKHGVLLTQETGGVGKTVYCVTVLQDGEYSIRTPQLPADTDGSQADMSSKLTTLRRLQLVSLLGLVADEDEEEAGQPAPNPTRPVSQPTETGGTKGQWDREAPLRKAVSNSNLVGTQGYSPGLKALILKCKQYDTKNAEDMPTRPAEGKQISMYDYLCSAIDGWFKRNEHQLVLSFLIGRVIGIETPPKMGHRFLIDNFERDVRPYLDEALNMARA